jgi:hypothetical protein
MSDVGWLIGKDIQSNGGELTGRQRFVQHARACEQAAAGEVQQDGSPFHLAQLLPVDHSESLGVEGDEKK